MKLWDLVKKNNIDAQEADIERRRQEAFEQITSPEDFKKLGLEQNKDELPYSTTINAGDENLEETLFADSKEKLIEKINAKYDAELTALESKTTTSSDKVVQTPSDIEAKKADINRRRQEELDFNYDNMKVGDTFDVKYNWTDKFETLTIFAKSKDGRAWLIGETKEKANWKNLKDFRGDRLKNSKENIDKINAKYDAELKALEAQTTSQQEQKAQQPVELNKKQQAIQVICFNIFQTKSMVIYRRI